MEMQFGKTEYPFMNWVTWGTQTQEQTQEVRLGDSLPDVGQVLASWGQCIIRSKEWRSSSAAVSGGVMAWTLYQPEDGQAPVCVDSWLPFQMKWDFPETERDGKMRVMCMLRSVDTRIVSARKLMVRANISALLEALEPDSFNLYAPQDIPEDIQLLRKTYPVLLPLEAGEKAFLLDEDITLKTAAGEPEKLVAYTVSPEITEQRIASDRAAFRGIAHTHIVYTNRDGKIQSHDADVPFSQYTDLQQSYGADAQAQILPAVTSLELEMEEDGNLRMKCGIVAQYLIMNRMLAEVVQDAYSPVRHVEPEQEMLQLPMILEQRRERISAEQTIAGAEGEVTDAVLTADQPRVDPTGDTAQIMVPAATQVLYYDGNGKLSGAAAKMEGSMQLPAAQDTVLHANMVHPGSVHTSGNGDGIDTRMDAELDITAISRQGIPMVTGLNCGETEEADPGRPSVILRRAGEDTLWELAKHYGSTVDAIRQANQLDNEPNAGQMLLIPVS